MKNPSAPHLFRGDEGGPLSRQLVTIRIVRLVDFMHRGSGLAFRRLSGLSDFEWRVLARVCETPPLSILELSGLLNRDGGQVSRTVSRLVSSRLLKRKNRGGGPGVCISPTPLGLAVYAPLVAYAFESEEVVTKGLSNSDLKNLNRYIEIMTNNALGRLGHEQVLNEEVPAPEQFNEGSSQQV